MNSAVKSNLFGQYKKRFKKKQHLWDILSIAYTLILIPLLKLLDGRDYSIIWRIISIAVTVTLISMNLIQSRAMKRQIEGISEAAAERLSAELESCEWHRVFAFTSEYLFSKEGLIIPYYEIEEAITNTYVSSVTATNICFKTRSFGRIYIPVGLGFMSEEFYSKLMQRCSTAEMTFKVNYQKANLEEYFNTIHSDSIVVMRKK